MLIAVTNFVGRYSPEKMSVIKILRFLFWRIEY